MIEKTFDYLALGLTRIFSSYGWNGTGTPKNFLSKLETIKHGIKNGQMYSYYTHLCMLYQAREQDRQWGMYSPVYLRALKKILEQQMEKEGKQISPEPQKILDIETPSDNIFKSTPYGKKAIKLLKTYGNTCIRYNAIEIYGIDRILSDLQEIFPKGTVTISEIVSPDTIRHFYYENTNEAVTMAIPVMPGVILTDGKKHRRIN